jgi:hypothetical protein
MIALWRKHLIVCLFLGLLAIPIYLMDMRSSATGGGGSWITLDFRGLIFWTYIAFLVIEVVLSLIAVLTFPKSGVLRIHFCSMVLSVILLVTGFIVYGKLLRAHIISDRPASFDREIAEEMALFPTRTIRALSCQTHNRCRVHPARKTFFSSVAGLHQQCRCSAVIMTSLNSSPDLVPVK